MPANTSSMQVTRVHAGKKVTRKYVHLSALASYGFHVALFTAALVYLATTCVKQIANCVQIAAMK